MYFKISCKFGKFGKDVLENHKITQAKKFKQKSAQLQKPGTFVLIYTWALTKHILGKLFL